MLPIMLFPHGASRDLDTWWESNSYLVFVWCNIMGESTGEICGGVNGGGSGPKGYSYSYSSRE